MAWHAAIYDIKTVTEMTKIKQKTLKNVSEVHLSTLLHWRFQNRYDEVYREGALWDHVTSLTGENCNQQFPYITCSKTSASHQ